MRVSAAAIAALLVAACGSQGGNNNAAAGSGPAAGQGPQSIQPGQWEMATQMSSIDIPGAPPEVVQQMRAQQGRTNTDRTCITPEQARNPLAQASRHDVRPARARIAGGWRTPSPAASSASARAAGSRAAGQGTAELSVEGSFTATTLDASLSVNATGPNMSGRPVPAMRATSIVRRPPHRRLPGQIRHGGRRNEKLVRRGNRRLAARRLQFAGEGRQRCRRPQRRQCGGQCRRRPVRSTRSGRPAGRRRPQRPIDPAGRMGDDLGDDLGRGTGRAAGRGRSRCAAS